MTHRPDLATVMGAIAPRGDSTPIAHLLDVQFWLMGRDVDHPGGNVLTRMGFVREPARRTPTRYRRESVDELLVLWAYGLFLGTANRAVLLLRGQVPTEVTGLDPRPLRKLDSVLAAHRAGVDCPSATLATACAWFADYETTVCATGGVAHRVPRSGPRPQLAPAEACSLENAWRDLQASYLASEPRSPAAP